jgi:hypothetical protein
MNRHRTASVASIASFTAVAYAALTVATLALGAIGSQANAQATESTCPLTVPDFYPCAVAAARTFEPPRTAEGVVDFGGYWRSETNGAAYNIEPAPASFSIPETPGVIVDPPDRQIPYQPWARERRDELLTDGYNDPQAHCAPSGSPRKNFTNYGWKIIQPAGHVLFVYESMHDYRVIATDGRAHLPESIRLWHEDPIGHWDGDTLVVDYTNANGRNWFDMSGNFQSENIHVVERYSMVDINTILFEATIEDPTLYTRPWTLAIPFRRNTEDGYYQLEYACHEGERDLQHIAGAGD